MQVRGFACGRPAFARLVDLVQIPCQAFSVPIRFDIGALGKVRKTPQGGIIAPAFLAKTGILKYTRADGSVVREYCPPEELFHADSLASLADAPVTDFHPPTMVEPGNFRQYSSGHAREAKADGDKVAAELVIQDAGLISAIERRERTQVSCGYTCRVDETPGTTPNGEAYDRIQRDRRYNHVAIVPIARAGSDVALRLDSSDNELAPSGPLTGATMLSIRFDGTDYPLGSEAEIKAALKAWDRLQAKQAESQATLDKLSARADSADEQVKDLKSKLAEATDPARLDARVKARTKLVSDARLVLGAEEKLDGLSDRDVQVKTLVKGSKSFSAEGKSDEYISARFDALIESKGSEETQRVRETAESVTRGDADPKGSNSEKARDAMNARNAEAWKQPLSATKDKQA